MPPAGLRGAAPLAAVALLVLGAPLALAGEDCLWYLDRNGSWHPGFNCEFFTFCCGTCYQRYCCRDLSLLITERQQKHCLAFRPPVLESKLFSPGLGCTQQPLQGGRCSGGCPAFREARSPSSPQRGGQSPASLWPGVQASMAVCVARTPRVRLEGEETCSLSKSQDHSGHRLGRDPLRGRSGQHHQLLPLLLLLPLPPAPAAAEPVRRPGDPHDRRPCAASVPIPPGPQSRPRTPTARLHVPTQRSCTPVSTLPGRTPSLQPCSSSPVRATPALLPRSLRSQLRLCRPSGG